MSFTILPKGLAYADCMVPFEILFRETRSVDFETLQNCLIKSKLLDPPENNLSEVELDALKSLNQNKTL